MDFKHLNVFQLKLTLLKLHILYSLKRVKFKRKDKEKLSIIEISMKREILGIPEVKKCSI